MQALTFAQWQSTLCYQYRSPDEALALYKQWLAYVDRFNRVHGIKEAA